MPSLASAVKKNPIEKTECRKAAVRPQMRNRTDCLSATLGGFKEKKIYKRFEATPVGKFRPEFGMDPLQSGQDYLHHSSGPDFLRYFSGKLVLLLSLQPSRNIN